MYIQRLDPQKLVRAYDISCQGIYPWKGVVETPFGAAFAVVSPGERTKRHAHQDGETFIVVKGRGTMRVGDESAPIQGGDVVYLPPFDQHSLENTAKDEDLVFLTVSWEDAAVWKERVAVSPPPAPARVMVTAAPPTPNGDLHLGHLSGPYLAADIHARYLRARGVDVSYVCGTDDNQSYVKTKAGQLGLSPQETADGMAEAIAATLRAALVDTELFVRPNASPAYARTVHLFFLCLLEQGHLVVREELCPYCEACQRFLFEAYIRGGCPHCGAATGGNSCEACGRPNDCGDLRDPSCAGCGAAVSRRACQRIVFPLARHADALREFHRDVVMSPRLRALCEESIVAGLPDIAVANVSDWGLTVPAEGFEDQRLYAWFEMAPRYLAYAEGLAEKRGEPVNWTSIWKAAGAGVVQCFGFDNGFFYAMLVPALLRAFDPGIRLPSAFVMNEFYRLDGLKFSTSRKHAIWGRDLLAKVPVSAVRFYLAYTCPEAFGTNFTARDFAETVERELSAPLGDWLADLGQRTAREASGAAPATGDWTDDHRRFHRRVEALVADIGASYEPATFSPQRATRALRELVREAHRFGEAEQAFARIEGRRQERRTAVALELLAAKTWAFAAAPLLPDLAGRLLFALGYAASPSLSAWEERPVWIPAGQPIGDLAGAVALPDAKELLARFA